MTQARTIVVLGCLFAAGCAEAQASPKREEATAEELAGLAKEGPKPQSSTQRFMPDPKAEVPPTEKSAAPTPTEWLKAPEALEIRLTDPKCSAKRIREWYRVGCRGYVSFLSGNREDVHVGRNEETYDAWLIFPARVGDVRAAQFLLPSKWSLFSDVVVTEQWLEGDPAPLITVTGIY